MGIRQEGRLPAWSVERGAWSVMRSRIAPRSTLHALRSLPLCPLLLCLLLALTACSVTQPVVKIGLAAPFEGRDRTAGYDVVYAVRLAVRERNAAGGVGGYRVELVSLDDGGDPAAAAEQARKLAIDPDVLAAIGHWRDDTTLAAAPVYISAGLPLVAAGVGAAGLPSQGPIIFRLYPTNAEIEAAATRYASAAPGLQRLIFVRGEADLAQVRASEQPDAVFLGLDAVPAAEAVVGLAQSGVHATWIGGQALADRQFAAIAGPAAEGAVAALGAPLPADLASPDEFVTRYRALANAEPGWRAPLAYDAANVLFDAIARAAATGRPSRSSVAEALRLSHSQGLIGPISFDDQGNWREARVYLYRLENGQLVLAGR